MYFDFHSHFLPQIDDGSRSPEESIQILDLMAQNETELIIATPHYYCSEQSVDKFIERRTKAFERIKDQLKPEHPKIRFGAEVLYDKALVEYEKLHDLCIDGTDWLLLEMPYTDLDDSIIDGVARITDRGDVKVLIAHIERYLNFTSFAKLYKLMDLDVLGQINAVSMKSFSSKRHCMKLIKGGYVQVLGSDFHRITREHIPVKGGYEVIEKKIKDFNAYTRKCGQMLLDNADFDDILKVESPV